MNSLSTFIRYYLLIGISLIILFSSTVYKGAEPLKTTYVEFPKIDTKPTVDSQKTTNTASVEHSDIELEVANVEMKTYVFNAEKNNNTANFKQADFWTTLHSVESKQGKLLYRPSNKNKNCDSTSSPCGHHQLSLQALKDISCTTKQCKRDREDFQKSLAMSKQLQALNDKRLKKAGYTNLPEYQKYLIHQQGASGLKRIIASSKGNKLLSKKLKRNMAGNSPYSYRTLRKMGSKLAAKKFLQYWEKKWQKEKALIGGAQYKPEIIVAENSTKIKPSTKLGKKSATINVTKEDPTIIVPLFNEHELQIALNIKI